MHVSPFAKSFASEGDCVIIIYGRDDTIPIILKANDLIQTKYGALRHNDIIGKRYGSQIPTSRGHVHILALNPVIWSHSLPHRTQILYPPDISLIVGSLDLRPGRCVLEAGTGSGSLTHALAQAIWPNGRVITFDFHELRSQKASEEFKSHGLDTVILAWHRDVVGLGFPIAGDELNPNGADAVVLDIPRPWEVVTNLPNVYNPLSGGRVCLFSPCIEQVQRSCMALQQTGFKDLHTYECLQRPQQVVRATLNVPNMGQLDIRALLAFRDTGQALKLPPNRKSLLPPSPILQPALLSRSPRRVRSSNDTTGPSVSKRRCHTLNVVGEINADQNLAPEQMCTEAKLASQDIGLISENLSEVDQTSFRWEAVPEAKIPGHTGYLTFASWLPRLNLDGPIRDDLRSQDDLHLAEQEKRQADIQLDEDDHKNDAENNHIVKKISKVTSACVKMPRLAKSTSNTYTIVPHTTSILDNTKLEDNENNI